jgi:hypothetical protein
VPATAPPRRRGYRGSSRPTDDDSPPTSPAFRVAGRRRDALIERDQATWLVTVTVTLPCVAVVRVNVSSFWSA